MQAAAVPRGSVSLKSAVADTIGREHSTYVCRHLGGLGLLSRTKTRSRIKGAPILPAQIGRQDDRQGTFNSSRAMAVVQF